MEDADAHIQELMEKDEEETQQFATGGILAFMVESSTILAQEAKQDANDPGGEKDPTTDNIVAPAQSSFVHAMAVAKKEAQEKVVTPRGSSDMELSQAAPTQASCDVKRGSL